VRYVEVPRKAANAAEWLQDQPPALANIEPGSDKLKLAARACARADLTTHIAMCMYINMV
jgi:hypothetical protein